jgi:hypothetical protein
MSFIKQSAFYLGLIAGLATIVAAGTVLLTYLFTGKLPAVKMAAPPEAGSTGSEKARMQLFTPDEIVALIRKQASDAEAADQPSADMGG